MQITYDPAKNARNINERGLSFDQAADFDWDGAVFSEDSRNPYPEQRFVAVGYLDKRLHTICFTPTPDGVRIISFRKANAREARDHGKTITTD